MKYPKLLVTAVALCLIVLPMMAAGRNDTKKIKTEQQVARKELKESTRKLETNKREIKKQINELSTLQKEIGARDYEIEALRGHIAAIDSNIVDTHRQIDVLTARLAAVKADYSRLLRRMQSQRMTDNPIGYLLSASSVRQMMERMRYLRAIRRQCARNVAEIEEQARLLGVKRADLTRMQQEKASSLGLLNSNKVQLQTKQKEMDRSVAKLRKEGNVLQNEIAKRKTQIANLDKRLASIIESDRKARQEKARKQQQQKKQQQPQSGKSKKGSASANSGRSVEKQTEPPTLMADEDRALNGSFEGNKGRLLFPVSGSYKVVRGFGKTYFGGKVETPHVGVDIQVPAGTKARAVFEGVVTNVSQLEGFNTIVVVRHGSYLTVYVNLSGVQVRAGQKVKAGQNIGTVAPESEGRPAVLQFGLRKERTELNPLLWVK